MKTRPESTTFIIGGSPAKKALQHIARAVGFVSDRGTDVGEGSVSAMLKGMIAGEVVVIPKDTTIGLTQVAWELGYRGVSGGPHILALLADIASRQMHVTPGWAVSWLEAQTKAGREVTDLELNALRRVESLMPEMVALLINQAIRQGTEAEAEAKRQADADAELQNSAFTTADVRKRFEVATTVVAGEAVEARE